MAVNQASFFLFPPRFGPFVETSNWAKTLSGPVRIASATLVDPDALSVKTITLGSWLQARGFVEYERYSGTRVLYFGEQKTCLGVQGQVELSLPIDEVEIDHLYIRFLLTEETPSHWNDWENLVVSLGCEFGFKMMGFGDNLIPCVDYFTLLTNDGNFCMFQSRFKWNVDRAT